MNLREELKDRKFYVPLRQILTCPISCPKHKFLPGTTLALAHKLHKANSYISLRNFLCHFSYLSSKNIIAWPQLLINPSALLIPHFNQALHQIWHLTPLLCSVYKYFCLSDINQLRPAHAHACSVPYHPIPSISH